MNLQPRESDVNWKNVNLANENTTRSTLVTGDKKRSRITRACDICRRKKIKCDTEDSKECSACKQYGWDCTFNDTTKKRGPPKGYIESLENRLRNMESLLNQMKPIQNKSKEKPNNNDSSSIVIPDAIEHNKVVKYLGSSSGYYLVRNILSTEEEEVEELNLPLKRKLEDPSSVRFRKINIDDDDIMYVRDKTLEEHVTQVNTDKSDLNPSILPKSILDQLIYRYFELHQVSLPIIDKEPFLDAYEGRTHPPPATILIYAICTHTASLLLKDDQIFLDSNISHDELHSTLIEYSSRLIKREYLVPRVATIQALVLLCGYPTWGESFYKNWLRSGMAVRMAQELGLHRSIEKLPLSDEIAEARKRLWYCVYITDRWICTVMGRPLAIADADCDIELPHVNGGIHGTKDYSIFNNFIKLSGILGEVLRRIYSPKARAQGYKSDSALHTVRGIYRLLLDWFEQLPDHQRITTTEAKTLYKDKIKTNKVGEAGPLMVCYYSVIILLYRTFLVSDNKDVLPELFDEANIRCTESATSAIDIARLISPSELVSFGWSFAGYGVFQATLVHLYNSTNSSPEISKLSKEYVRVCTEECIKPASCIIGVSSKHVLPLIRTLMHLTGADKEDQQTQNDLINKKATEEHKNTNVNTNYNTQYTSFNANATQSSNISPMSVHSIVSPEPASEQFSNAAWQNIFSSAATPFFDSNANWQILLSSLLDENLPK